MMDDPSEQLSLMLSGLIAMQPSRMKTNLSRTLDRLPTHEVECKIPALKQSEAPGGTRKRLIKWPRKKGGDSLLV